MKKVKKSYQIRLETVASVESYSEERGIGLGEALDELVGLSRTPIRLLSQLNRVAELKDLGDAEKITNTIAKFVIAEISRRGG